MKRNFSTILLLALALLLLAGCVAGGSSPKEPQSAAPGSAQADGVAQPAGADLTRKVKEEIIFAQGQDIYSLVPWFTRLQRTTGLTTNIFEGLVYFDPNMEVYPMLGTAWEWKDDVTLVFQIRENVYFHNGELMKPSDVAYSLNTLAKEPYMTNNAGWIKNVEVTGEHEITIHLKAPYGAALGALCHPAMVVAPEAYMEDPAKPYETMPIGTGAYKMMDYKVGEYYKMERHEQYWEGEPPTKYLTLQIIPEPTQRTIMLETGMIDVAYEIPMNDYARVEEDENLKLWVSDSMKIYMFFPNCASKGPVGNKLVRQALMHALDSQIIVDSMLYGYGKPAPGLVMPTVLGYEDRSEDLRYDPELAKQLLTEAGYPNGCTVKMWTSSEQNRVEMCQIFQALCQDVGINLEIEIMDQATSDSLREAGEDYGLVVHFQNNMPKHVDQTFFTSFYTGLKTNYSNYANPAFDKLADAIRETPVENTARLAELSHEAYDLLFDEVPAIPVYNESIVIGSNANLEGLQISQVGAHKYQNACIYVD